MELRLIFMLSSDVEVSDTAYGLNFRKEIEEVYVGDTWQECCDDASDYWDYDTTMFPTDENGDIGDTRKDLIKVRKKVDSNWEEYSEEEEKKIIDYFDEQYEKKMMAG